MSTTIPVAILGIGSHLPVQIRGNGFWDGVAFIEDRHLRLKRDFLEQTKEQHSDEFAALQLRIMNRYMKDPFRGGRERRVADDDMCAADLEERAARHALEDAGIRPGDVDMILINSCPADDFLPNNGTEIQRRLGCGSIPVMGVDTACTSFQSMLMIADSFIQTSRAHHVLAVTSAMMTRLTEREDPMSITLGDGAAAVVVGPARGGGRLLAHVQRGAGEYRDVACCAPKDGRRWYEGHGRLIGMTRNVELSRKAVMDTAKMAHDALELALAQTDFRRQDITHYFTHQGAVFLNEVVRSACGLEHAESENSFSRYGSVGASNIPINIVEYTKRSSLSSDSLIFLFSVGMGLTWAASLLRWD